MDKLQLAALRKQKTVDTTVEEVTLMTWVTVEILSQCGAVRKSIVVAGEAGITRKPRENDEVVFRVNYLTAGTK